MDNKIEKHRKQGKKTLGRPDWKSWKRNQKKR